MSRTHEETYDVIVIGGGASGMMAAGRAGARGLRVLLIEKNRVLGKKLSISGGGRCNITNAEFDTRALLAHYGDAAKFLYSPFAQFNASNTFEFFTSRGLPLITTEHKRAFPKSESAIDVVNIMKRYVEAGNVTVLHGVGVESLLTEGDVVRGVATAKGAFYARSVILSTGGMSHAETGSTGDGFVWLRAQGHTVHAPTPGIVPLKVKEDWVTKLAGKTLTNMKITFGSGAGRIQKTGRLLFTHFGISGPLVLNSAREVKKMLTAGPVPFTLDLFPDKDSAALDTYLSGYFTLHKNKTIKNALKELVPPGMADVVLTFSGIADDEKKVHSVTRDERKMLVRTCKELVATVVDTMGFDWAVVSDGGIDLNEVDMKTMASKRYKNLFLTGDILNINRPSGGYSLQLCWTTGWVAGSHA